MLPLRTTNDIRILALVSLWLLNYSARWQTINVTLTLPSRKCIKCARLATVPLIARTLVNGKLSYPTDVSSNSLHYHTISVSKKYSFLYLNSKRTDVLKTRSYASFAILGLKLPETP